MEKGKHDLHLGKMTKKKECDGSTTFITKFKGDLVQY
jgi:hypothetical protein